MMLIAGTTPGTHSGWVLQGKFQEPGAVRPQERLVRAAAIEANFQIPFVSSLPKPRYKHSALLAQTLSRHWSIWVAAP